MQPRSRSRSPRPGQRPNHRDVAAAGGPVIPDSLERLTVINASNTEWANLLFDLAAEQLPAAADSKLAYSKVHHQPMLHVIMLICRCVVPFGPTRPSVTVSSGNLANIQHVKLVGT